VERALGKVRFARLIHSGARVLGGPAVRAASGGDLSLADCYSEWYRMSALFAAHQLAA
jgi:hypothetical protein